jgi:hypothetical protein
MMFFVSVSTTNAFTLKFDDLVFGPQAKLYGSVNLDWISYPVRLLDGTTSRNSEFSSVEAWYKIDGDTLYCKGQMTRNASASAGANGTFYVSAPAGKFYSTPIVANRLAGTWSKTGFNSPYTLDFTTDGTSALFEWLNQFASSYYQYNNTNFPPNQIFAWKAEFKLAGASSSQLLSSDADTRVVAAKMAASTTTSLTQNNNIVVNLKTNKYDTHGMVDTANNRFNIKVPGDYVASASITTDIAATDANGTIQMFARINGSTYYQLGVTSAVNGTSSYISIGGNSILQSLKAGDYVELVIFQQVRSGGLTALANADITHFSIHRLSGPAQIAASEVVAAKATISVNQTLAPNLSFVKATFNTAGGTNGSFDTHGGFDAANSRYVAKVSGYYRVSCVLTISGTNILAARYLAIIYKGGTSGTEVGRSLDYIAVAGQDLQRALFT